MNGNLFFSFVLLLATTACSQWSTSTVAESALSVCPGLSSEIITFADGSSIIIGRGDNNETWMQKLDSYGYRQWLPWVPVFPAMSGTHYNITDDDGGAYAIVGTIAQRVDKNGNLRWGANGKSLVPTGNFTNVIPDGKNGIIALYNRYDGSKQRVSVLRFDSTGARLWETMIDSSAVQNSLSAQIVGRLGSQTLLYSSNAKDKFIDLNGKLNHADSTYLRPGVFIKDSDTTGFNIQELSVNSDSTGYLIKERVIKYLNNWDSLWTITLEYREPSGTYLNAGYPYRPDYSGNLYRFQSYYDNSNTGHTRIRYITPKGVRGDSDGYVIEGIAGRYFFASKSKIGFVTDYGIAQEIDTSGNILWPNGFIVIANQEFDVNYIQAASDNNGGGILSYWTPRGGIYAQHTGRNGKVGIITKISSPKEASPTDFQVFQNFPNPFNGTTKIKFSIPKTSEIGIKIYDALGKEVEVLLQHVLSSGVYEVQWNANRKASGVYFYRIQSGSAVKINKMLLLK